MFLQNWVRNIRFEWITEYFCYLVILYSCNSWNQGRGGGNCSKLGAQLLNWQKNWLYIICFSSLEALRIRFHRQRIRLIKRKKNGKCVWKNVSISCYWYWKPIFKNNDFNVVLANNFFFIATVKVLKTSSKPCSWSSKPS